MRATNSDTASSESGGPNGQAPSLSTVFSEDTEFVMWGGLTATDFTLVVLPPALLFLVATDVLGYAVSWPLLGTTLGVTLGLFTLVRATRDVRRVTFDEYETALREMNARSEASGGENAESGTHSTPTTPKED